MWTAILVLLIAAEFSMMMVYYNTVLHAKLLSQLASHSSITVEKVMNVMALISDLSLAMSLVVLLQRRRMGGFSSTSSVIKLIIAYTIGTSLLSALLSLMALVLVIVYPDSFVWLAVDLLVSKCELPLFLA